MAEEIHRSPIESIERPRRGLDERLFLAAPWLLRGLTAMVMRRPAGSRVRRAVLTYAQQIGWEATNRADWEANFLPFHPDFEFRITGDPLRIGPDIRDSYRGHAEVRDMIETWQSGFDEFRFEPRELLDPGGDRLGARCEQIGRAGGGLEVRQKQWVVWWLTGGLIVRQATFWEEEPALEALRRG